MSSQQEDRHPNRKSQTQQKVLTQKEDLLRECLPNRKNDTQTANQKPNRKTCPTKETCYVFPTGRPTPKEEITNPPESPDPERRFTKQKDSFQKGDSFRKISANSQTFSQSCRCAHTLMQRNGGASTGNGLWHERPGLGPRAELGRSLETQPWGPGLGTWPAPRCPVLLLTICKTKPMWKGLGRVFLMPG